LVKGMLGDSPRSQCRIRLLHGKCAGYLGLAEKS